MRDAGPPRGIAWTGRRTPARWSLPRSRRRPRLGATCLSRRPGRHPARGARRSRAHTRLRRVPSRRGALRRFVTHGYWRLVAERRVAIGIAAACSSRRRSSRAPGRSTTPAPRVGSSGRIPERDAAAGRGRGPRLRAGRGSRVVERDHDEQHPRHTARVRGRNLSGVGTAAVLILNGVLLGVVAGLAVGAGNGRPFFELVAAHGVLELSCIVVAGAAGLRFGWALRRTGAAAPGARH